jgi:hypothetical protein
MLDKQSMLKKEEIAGTSSAHFVQHQKMNSSMLHKFPKVARQLVVSGIKLCSLCRCMHTCYL